jgi:hypothetical protein
VVAHELAKVGDEAGVVLELPLDVVKLVRVEGREQGDLAASRVAREGALEAGLGAREE